MADGRAMPPEDERAPSVCWWPTKHRVPVGSNLDAAIGDKYVIFTGYAWWQWRQRLRNKSVRNLERWYLQPFIFGRDNR